MSTLPAMARCPLVANDWPTETDWDGRVTLKSPLNPVHCRGLYYRPPASSRPRLEADGATWPTVHDCPLDNPRRCPHWLERMEWYGDRFGIPPRSRKADVEDLPGDLADEVVAYLGSIQDNVDGGRNIIITGPVGAGKTCLTGLILITYARLTRTETSRFIGAEELFQLPGTPHPERTHGGNDEWRGLVDAPLLVIDDLGTELATSGAVRNWNRLIDGRYQGRRATIITTNAAELDELFHDERSRSRFMGNCLIWRTERGDMRGVAEVPVGASDGGRHNDPVAEAEEAETLAACLPQPKTPQEWEAVAAEIRARPNPGSTDLAFLMADYGIPAVATFRFGPSCTAEAESRLRDLLVRIAATPKYEHLLEAIAWRSHDHGFEYPEGFVLVNWRERLAETPWSDRTRGRYGIPMPEAVGHDGAGNGQGVSI